MYWAIALLTFSWAIYRTTRYGDYRDQFLCVLLAMNMAGNHYAFELFSMPYALLMLAHFLSALTCFYVSGRLSGNICGLIYCVMLGSAPFAFLGIIPGAYGREAGVFITLAYPDILGVGQNLTHIVAGLLWHVGTDTKLDRSTRRVAYANGLISGNRRTGRNNTFRSNHQKD